MAVCGAMSTFRNVEIFAPPFSYLHPLLLLNVHVPSFIPSSPLYRLISGLRDLFGSVVSVSGCMSWNMKASILLPYRCPLQPWCLALKKVGIAENNSTTLHCQQI